VLPDGRLLLVGGGRPTATDADGMIGILTQDGAADTSFSPTGTQLFDFGGTADMLWSVALSPLKNQAVAVGTKGGGTGNDDAVFVLLPLAE
jgi:hypothetical protein